MRDDPSVVGLVERAREGDRRAWDEIVERYAPLVWAICRRYRLSGLDADDVSQGVWLRLVEQLRALREPAALPGWLVTTTRRECLRVIGSTRRHELVDEVPDPPADARGGWDATDEELVLAERAIVLRTAFAQLPSRCQQLLSLLTRDPSVPYGEISARMRMPVGSIGPSRARCLDKLRRSPALAALIIAETGSTGGGERRERPMVER